MPSLVILLFVSGVYWDNGYCLKYFSILLLCNIVFHLATWSIDMKTIRWWCVSYTNTHTPNLKSMTMPYLGRVPSPGWKRACNFISHPEMWKDGLGGWGGSGLCYFPWGCWPLSWPLYFHRFSPAYQGHTITTNFNSLSQSGAVISLCAIWSCSWLLIHLFTNHLVPIFRLMAPLFCW